MSVDMTIDAALDANAADDVAATDAAAIDTTTTSDTDTVSDTENTDSGTDTAESDADNADAAASDTGASDTGAFDTAASGTGAVLDTGTEVTFASLDLPAPLLGVLNEAGVVTAFPIQAATIPDALIGRDVLGRGRTGSGKTLAFGLPTLARLEGLRAKPRRPLALVLVPTRELAMQVEDALRPYARSLRLRIRSVYGGAPMRKQIDGLRYGVELLVATPGRLSDLIERGECELDEVDVAILDEADQMCDMGFLPHVCELMDQVAQGGQRLLFSATLDGAVDEIVKKYMKDPALHEVDPQAGAVTTMSHHLLMVAPQHKAKVAAQIAGRHSTEGGNAEARSIFFVRTQMAVDRVTEQLRERGLPAAGLHGGMTQVARTKTLEDFKEGRTPVLIATDVAARGIHVDGIDLVVHLDPARDSKDYLHRAGRTARAGQAGVVASLILPKQRKQAQRMMDDAGVTAEELDTAPLGAGPKWESAGAALVELTGAREVPEPGAVAPFKLPVRERERAGFRSNDRRDGDRFRGNRDGGYRDGGYRGNSDRYARNDRHSGGFGGSGSATTTADGNTGSGTGGAGSGSGTGSNGYVRRDGERFERNNRDENRDERRGTSPARGFARRDGDRDNRGYSRDDQRGRTFDRRDGERHGYGRDRDDQRGGSPAAGRGFEQRGSAGRSFDSRGSSGRGFEDRGSQRPGFERRAFDNRGSDERGANGHGANGHSSEGRRYDGGRFENRGSENRNFDGRGTGGRGFNDRGADSRSWSDRGDRSRSADRSGQGDRFGRDEPRGGGSRPRSDWDRGKQPYTSRDGKPRS